MSKNFLIVLFCILQFTVVLLTMPNKPDFSETLSSESQTINKIIDNALPINISDYKTLLSLSNLSYHLHSNDNKEYHPNIYLNNPSFAFTQKAPNYNFELKFQEEQKVLDFVVDTKGEQIFIVTDKLNVFKISEFNTGDPKKAQQIKLCTAKNNNDTPIQEKSAQFLAYEDQILIVISPNYFMFCTLKTKESLLVPKSQLEYKNSPRSISYPAAFYENLIFVPIGKDGVDIYEFYQGQLRYELTYSYNNCDIRQVQFLEKQKVLLSDYNLGIRQLSFEATTLQDSGEQKLSEFVLSSEILIHKHGIIQFALDKNFMVLCGINPDGTSFTSQWQADFEKKEFKQLNEYSGHEFNIEGIQLLPEFLFVWNKDKFISTKRSFHENSDNLEDAMIFEFGNLQSAYTFQDQASKYVIFLTSNEHQQLNLYQLELKATIEIALPLDSELKKDLEKNNKTQIDFTYWTKSCTKKTKVSFANEFQFCEVKQSIQITLNPTHQIQTTSRHDTFNDYSSLIKVLLAFIIILVLILVIYLVCTQFEVKPRQEAQEIEYGMAGAETAM